MRTARAIAFGVPLALFVIVGAPAAYWLDSGEFVAAGVGLAVAHPPGHPLYVLVAKAATLLPLGPIAFRVSLASALAAALCAWALFSAARTIAKQAGAGDRAATALAFSAAIAVTASRSLGLQAVRAEVYALEAICTLGALALASHAVVGDDRRPLMGAALLLGLGLSNHHFLAILALPGLAGALAVVMVEGRRAGHTAGAFARRTATALALGLCPYLLLPLRSRAPESIAAADDPLSFWWVVSARVYQRSTALAPEGAFERIADVVELLSSDLAGVGLLAGLGGLYCLARVPGLRRWGPIWIPPALLYPAARAWLGFVRDNPDAAGYCVPGLGALAIAAVAFGATLVAALQPRRPEIVRIGLGVTAAMAVVIGPGGFDRYSLARFWAAEELVGQAIGTLEPRGILVAARPETAFVAASLRATSAERPDVTVIALPLLGYPGHASAVVRRDGVVSDLVRGVRLHGAPPETELAALAGARPVLIEPDPRLSAEVVAYLSPAGPFARAYGEPVSLADLEASAPQHEARWAAAQRRLGSWARDDRETRNVLLWRRYQEALVYAARGARTQALESALAAEDAVAGTPELRDLRLALQNAHGPIDVAPFQPRVPQ